MTQVSAGRSAAPSSALRISPPFPTTRRRNTDASTASTFSGTSDSSQFFFRLSTETYSRARAMLPSTAPLMEFW